MRSTILEGGYRAINQTTRCPQQNAGQANRETNSDVCFSAPQRPLPQATGCDASSPNADQLFRLDQVTPVQIKVKSSHVWGVIVPFEQRQSERFVLSAPVDVIENGTRVAFGSIVDISRDGLGFQTMQDLALGRVYKIEIRGFGLFKSKIVNKAGMGRYGAIFQADEMRKSKLETRIREFLNDR